MFDCRNNAALTIGDGSFHSAKNIASPMAADKDKGVESQSLQSKPLGGASVELSRDSLRLGIMMPTI